MRGNPFSSRRLIVAAFALVLSACNGNGGLTSGAPGMPLPSQSRAGTPAFAPMRRHAQSGKIQHVVIIVQENRSFNDLFYKYPGAKTATYGYNTSDQKITLLPIPLETTWDIEHDSWGFEAACNGTGSIPGTDCQMNGFDNESYGCGSNCPNKNPPYSYVPHYETKPYFAMAHQYVLADQMYASNFDASSFISHQFIIAAQAEASVNFPDGAWGCPGGSGDTIALVGPDRQVPDGYQRVCYSDNTLGEEADGASPPVTWAYYAASYSGYPWIWSAYQANQYVYYGSDWSKDVESPPSQFLTDVANGNLRQISWVTPTWGNSDHAGSGSNTGPAWVASLVNAIGQSQYWDNTAIFIFWDDYGGWYDPEPPAYLDNYGLGMRIPMLVVSAYARKGHVSHVHYEHGSILKFVEDTFGLGRLSASDTRATSPEKDCFDFNKPPRAFQVIPSVLGKDYFLHEAPDHHIPDAE
jgi:phospholipase C